MIFMTDINVAQLKDQVARFRDLIFEAGERIWNNPETGYKEWETSAYLADIFTELGYEVTNFGDIPGFFVDLDTGRPGPTVAVLGEMDALYMPEHPAAHPERGTAHACGHHAQCAALVGVAAALSVSGALDGLSGRIRLMAVPAEELIELEYREGLRKKGIIRYYGGKVELMHRGYFDSVDIAFMIHTGVFGKFAVRKGSNGCIVKNILYKGTAAHAGGSPNMGVNALYAATLGIQAVNALRETFIDSDHVRFHPIVTRAGGAVNIIPAEAKLESYLRASSMPAMMQANRNVNLALAASAAAIGANVEISDSPGYSPLNNDPTLNDLAFRAMEAVVGPDHLLYDIEGWSTGSTDMGDVSAVIPSIHPYSSGAVGKAHGSDYAIADPERAYVNSAQVQVVLLNMLLRDDAAMGKAVKAGFKSPYANIRAYLDYIDTVKFDKEAVTYCDDGSVRLEFANLNLPRRRQIDSINV